MMGTHKSKARVQKICATFGGTSANKCKLVRFTSQLSVLYDSIWRHQLFNRIGELGDGISRARWVDGFLIREFFF